MKKNAMAAPPACTVLAKGGQNEAWESRTMPLLAFISTRVHL